MNFYTLYYILLYSSQIAVFAQESAIGSGISGSTSASAWSSPMDESWNYWWSYSAISGPAFWGLMNPAWFMCDKGRRQSPIDIQTDSLVYDPSLTPLKIDNHLIWAALYNDGHAIVLNRTSTNKRQAISNDLSPPFDDKSNKQNPLINDNDLNNNNQNNEIKPQLLQIDSNGFIEAANLIHKQTDYSDASGLQLDADYHSHEDSSLVDELGVTVNRRVARWIPINGLLTPDTDDFQNSSLNLQKKQSDNDQENILTDQRQHQQQSSIADYEQQQQEPVITFSGAGLTYSYQFERLYLRFGQEERNGSEHRLNGRQFAAELQILAYNSQLYANFQDASGKPSGLMAISILIDLMVDQHQSSFTSIAAEQSKSISKKYDLLDEKLIGSSNLDKIKSRGSSSEPIQFNISEFLPKTDQFVTYEGSLTIPGCQETVTWIVLNKPMHMSPNQLQNLRSISADDNAPGSSASGKLIAGNVRPVQPVNGRMLRTNIRPISGRGQETKTSPATILNNLKNMEWFSATSNGIYNAVGCDINAIETAMAFDPFFSSDQLDLNSILHTSSNNQIQQQQQQQQQTTSSASSAISTTTSNYPPSSTSCASSPSSTSNSSIQSSPIQQSQIRYNNNENSNFGGANSQVQSYVIISSDHGSSSATTTTTSSLLSPPTNSNIDQRKQQLYEANNNSQLHYHHNQIISPSSSSLSSTSSDHLSSSSAGSTRPSTTSVSPPPPTTSSSISISCSLSSSASSSSSSSASESASSSLYLNDGQQFNLNALNLHEEHNNQQQSLFSHNNDEQQQLNRCDHTQQHNQNHNSHLFQHNINDDNVLLVDENNNLYNNRNNYQRLNQQHDHHQQQQLIVHQNNNLIISSAGGEDIKPQMIGQSTMSDFGVKSSATSIVHQQLHNNYDQDHDQDQLLLSPNHLIMMQQPQQHHHHNQNQHQKTKRCRHITDYVLADEEKRLLIKEGHTDFPMSSCQARPLTKDEEKLLRRIRRKIRNKKSAQCSRQRKKEYVEDLEKRYEAVIKENQELRQIVDRLQL